MKAWLRLFVFFVTLCCIIPLFHSNCIPDQQLSLLHFKKSLSFNGRFVTSNLLTWNSSIDCCHWAGVTCSSDGRVVGLDIAEQLLTSSIDDSSSLFDLQHLESLNLANNDFNGSQIPSAIGKLSNLRYLNLSDCDFSGQIPIEISQLTKLVFLKISYTLYQSNPVKLENPNLRLLVQNLTELEELYLDYVNISAHGKEWCQAISYSLPKLRVLSLSQSAISGPFHQSLVSLKSLSVIQLNGNKISSPVPGFFASFSNLTFLDLSGCGLLGTFPKQIFELPSLQLISLSENPELHGSLPNSIGNLKMLSTLDISACNFTGSIPVSIGNLTHMVYLDMSSNRFIGQLDFIHWENLVNLEALYLESNILSGRVPSSIFSSPFLKELYLSDNQFSGPFPELSNNSSYSLFTLDLSRNNLEGTIPVSIYNLGGLSQLLLSSNNFSSFPFNGPQSLNNLTWIDLSYNSLLVVFNGTNSSSSSFPHIEVLDLTSNMLKTIPEFLKNHSSLYSLELSANHIQAQIPNWIWNLDSLLYLNLSYNSIETVEAPLLGSSSVLDVLDLHSNQLQGRFPFFPLSVSFLDYSRNNLSSSIPTVISDAVNLVFLSLFGNNLEGHIPVSICNATLLEFLDLSKNSLSGTIPKCLSQNELQVLNFRGNSFTGTISDFEFPEGCRLETLNLNGNEIKGQFPKSLGNCTKLELLDIGNNQIRDTFPCMLKSISTLRVLKLRSNKFHGSIECPETNGTWPVLQIIDLANNSFSGEVSGASLTTWDAMVLANGDDSPYTINYTYDRGISRQKGISVSFEDEIGTISKGLERELVKINLFTLIDLSGNKFNGSIPEELGEFKLLFSLNLSSNAFTGEIPASFGNMKRLESLDLSNNNLSGQIPAQLAELNFLAVLDLSNNQLVGRIPTSTQFSTFPKASFQGNKDLWGPPLTVDNTASPSPESPPTFIGNHPNSGDEFDWNIISVEIGFTFGCGIAIGSLLFYKRWRIWYYRTMYNYILLKIFPQLEERIGNHRRHAYTGPRYLRR